MPSWMKSRGLLTKTDLRIVKIKVHIMLFLFLGDYDIMRN